MGAIKGPAQSRHSLGVAAEPSPTAAIEVRGLSKSYGSRVAVNSVDLTVAAGTLLGLLGPNGAGKTTLIRMLSTVLTPDAGSFRIAGLAQAAAIRLRVGVLPESPGYPRGQTCAEWLTYHARLYGMSRRDARARADQVLDEVGLTERRQSLIATLSRGMRQRLGFARSLINSPSVVFLDEPTLGLDPLGQRQVLALIQRIARDRGVTVALSTHELGEVEQVCDRVVILNQGHIVADGSVAEVVRQAAAPREAVLRVPPHLRTKAARVLSVHGLVVPTETHDGLLDEIALRTSGDVLPEQASGMALRHLLDAGVPVLEFRMRGGRLSDAFLAVTGESHDE